MAGRTTAPRPDSSYTPHYRNSTWTPMRPTAGGQTERAAIRPAIARLISCRRWAVLILRTSTRRAKQSDILIVKTLRSTTTLYHFRRTCGLRPECLIRSPLSITSATFSYSIKICAEYRWERTVVVVVVVIVRSFDWAVSTRKSFNRRPQWSAKKKKTAERWMESATGGSPPQQ